jgi:CcmD family protein
MGDLVYAALVIIVIWAGIFFYLVGLDRRLRRLEQMLQGGSAPGTGQSGSVAQEEETGSREADSGK